MILNTRTSNSLILAFEIGYDIDGLGCVYSPKMKILKCGLDKSGYKRFFFRNEGKVNLVMVHQFAAYKKFGFRIFETECVRHKNGIKIDNSKSNILIGSNVDNQQDIPFKIRKQRSTKAASLLVKHDKNAVISFYNKANSYKSTMEHFNISSKGTLWHILNK